MPPHLQNTCPRNSRPIGCTILWQTLKWVQFRLSARQYQERAEAKSTKAVRSKLQLPPTCPSNTSRSQQLARAHPDRLPQCPGTLPGSTLVKSLTNRLPTSALRSPRFPHGQRTGATTRRAFAAPPQSRQDASASAGQTFPRGISPSKEGQRQEGPQAQSRLVHYFESCQALPNRPLHFGQRRFAHVCTILNCQLKHPDRRNLRGPAQSTGLGRNTPAGLTIPALRSTAQPSPAPQLLSIQDPQTACRRQPRDSCKGSFLMSSQAGLTLSLRRPWSLALIALSLSTTTRHTTFRRHNAGPAL